MVKRLKYKLLVWLLGEIKSLKSTLPISIPIGGIRISFTNDVTILPKAPPMITPTAISITLPLSAKALNSFKNPIIT